MLLSHSRLSFSGHRSLFLLDLYPVVPMLGHKVFKYSAMVEMAKRFSKVVIPNYPPPERV